MTIIQWFYLDLVLSQKSKKSKSSNEPGSDFFPFLKLSSFA